MNDPFVTPSGQGGDIDIHLANALIEVKSGRNLSGILHQIQKLQDLGTGKTVIVYAPKAGAHTAQQIQAAGALLAGGRYGSLEGLIGAVRP